MAGGATRRVSIYINEKEIDASIKKIMPVTDKIDGQITTEEQFYAEARIWASIVRNIAKSNARKFDKGKDEPKTYKTGSKAGQTEKKLVDSINFKVHRNILQVPVSVGFKVPIHGIWGHWGVGLGLLS